MFKVPGAAADREEISRMPPFRQLSDFFPGWKSFARPTDFRNFHDILISNLLYYQTNYLVLSTVVFVIAGFRDPMGVITGTAVMLGVYLVSFWVGELQPAVSLKRQNPLAFFITVIVVIHLVTRMLVNVRTFVSATTVSLAVMIPHGSFRLRNMNEVEYMKEAERLKGSPMGVLFMARGKMR